MAMRLYVVGGAVRDALLGRPASDRDWVAVGATPAELIALGYRPVGKDFPVFVDPKTGEQVALARTERKTGPGYHGFAFHAAPDVTLEQDLARRDLTVNAIARADDGTLIDPYGGQRDLRDRVLRHVSDAFAEDPVRLLRVARFAAQLPEFAVAPETLALLRRMVDAGEVDALVSERVWQELARGLMAAQPSRMFEVLRTCGALARLMPEVDRLWGAEKRVSAERTVDAGEHLLRMLDIAGGVRAALPVRWACLCIDLAIDDAPRERSTGPRGHASSHATAAARLAERLRAPADCRALADVVAREHRTIGASAGLGASALLQLFERCDALRRPDRFDDALLACACDARASSGDSGTPYAPALRLPGLLRAALAVDGAAVAAAAQHGGLHGPAIGAAVRQARVDALAGALKSLPQSPAAP
jgi:tRNA nucleotidyltransferase (CCA-adding enzyme)